MKIEEPEIVVSSSDEKAVPIEDTPITNVKITELSQCDKCGKKLTARTLKYSHNKVCPANENKPIKKPIVKEIEEPIKTEKPTPKPERVKRQEKINKLFEAAV